MHAELATIFADVHASPECDAVVVTGEGKAFSAGGDLDWIAEQVGNHERDDERDARGGRHRADDDRLRHADHQRDQRSRGRRGPRRRA